MTDTVVGVVLLSRHGDRSGFYQDPVTYTATGTVLTPLGETQEYQLGSLLRSRYFNAASPLYILGSSTELLNNAQVNIVADAGGEGSVIFDSSVALTQGLFPASTASSTTLANGTVVQSPLGGYQYVQVTTIEPDQDISLEGFTECPALAAQNQAFFASEEFKQVASENEGFLDEIQPLLDGRNNSLVSMYNVFDFMNVNNIHNASFHALVTQQQMEQARSLANYHQYNSFSGPNRADIDNIAAQTILPEILSGLSLFTNSSQSLKYRHLVISYKPFVSLFKITNISDTYPELQGIVDYTSTLAFELHQSNGEYSVQVAFKNGTADFQNYNMFGDSGPTSFSQFNETLAPYAISDLETWCNKCDNHESRGCELIAEANANYGTSNKAPGQDTSPLASGFIGACVTLVLVLLALVFFYIKGWIAIGRSSKRNSRASQNLPLDPMSKNYDGHL